MDGVETYAPYPKCSMCQGNWHGLPRYSGCPGEYGTPEQIEAWRHSGSMVR